MSLHLSTKSPLPVLLTPSPYSFYSPQLHFSHTGLLSVPRTHQVFLNLLFLQIIYRPPFPQVPAPISLPLTTLCKTAMLPLILTLCSPLTLLYFSQ